MKLKVVFNKKSILVCGKIRETARVYLVVKPGFNYPSLMVNLSTGLWGTLVWKVIIIKIKPYIIYILIKIARYFHAIN